TPPRRRPGAADSGVGRLPEEALQLSRLLGCGLVTEGLEAQRRQALGLLGTPRGLLREVFGLLCPPQRLGALFRQLLEREEALAVGPEDGQLGAGEVEADAEPWADEAVHLAVAEEGGAAADVAVQAVGLRVVVVVLLDAVVVVEGQLVRHLRAGVARRV